MVFRWSGGIHQDDAKSATKDKEIIKAKPPQMVYLPVAMHIGTPCEPLVEVGQRVKVGQKIADTEALVSAPIHATISGIVTEIEPMKQQNGTKVKTIVIKNDFEDTPYTNLPSYNYAEMSAEEIIQAIREAGIVGHGGASFPTHIKMSGALGKIDTIIINGAECEPYITSDYRLLLEEPEALISGIKILEKIFDIQNIKIGIEKNKKPAFAGILEAIKEAESCAKLVPLNTRYPQGAEKQLIYALTRRKIPSGKRPTDVSCIVFNVDTIITIDKLFKTGMPDVRRIVTISGSAIGNAKNIYAPIGTLVEHLIDECGGFTSSPNKLIMGGPMMGVAQSSIEIPIIKGTNAFLAFCEDEDKIQKNPACLKCGKCVSACPMGLAPVYMNLYAHKKLDEEYKEIGGLDCVECGCCSYICPARVQLAKTFKATKQKIIKKEQILKARQK